MSPRKRRSAVLDADASIEEVEAAAAEAQARANSARARAQDLRRQVSELDDRTVVEKIADWSRPRWLRLPSVKLLALAEAIVLVCASLAVTVVMVLHHRQVEQEQRRAAEFTAAARQSVVTMMTIDPATVQQNMKDVIANSTGKFKSALEAGEADELIKGAQQSKMSTKASVQSVAVESMTENSAVVLVAATIRRHRSGQRETAVRVMAHQRQPRAGRRTDQDIRIRVCPMSIDEKPPANGEDSTRVEPTRTQRWIRGGPARRRVILVVALLLPRPPWLPGSTTFNIVPTSRPMPPWQHRLRRRQKTVRSQSCRTLLRTSPTISPRRSPI